ncbi:MAG: MogA/MoaB family molybdenum cofactor biosynthesis protein [Candidatus Sericytochromatia bacterium]|nr:MogA/MoaB family molybdenum cofactor biosynthesis protein [Candidatus Sericytochromatia bacterium]
MDIAILTLSDSRGPREDESGRVVAEIVARWPGATVRERAVLPDDRPVIEAALRRLADEAGVALVLTTGGTGVAPRDVTPEATLAVCDRLVPGLPELMRAVSLAKTPMASLSRAQAGLRGSTLIVNLPGSPRGARECLEAIAPVLPHAVTLAGGGRPH